MCFACEKSVSNHASLISFGKKSLALYLVTLFLFKSTELALVCCGKGLSKALAKSAPELTVSLGKKSPTSISTLSFDNI